MAMWLIAVAGLAPRQCFSPAANQTTSPEHTALVALVGQNILRANACRDVTAEDWLHFTLAALAHDIGYVRGIRRADRPGAYVIDASGKTVSPPRGASDAFLGPWHVERSKIAVRERFGDTPSSTRIGSVARSS